MECTRGQKCKLKDLTPSLVLVIDVAVDWKEKSDLDFSCFGLDEENRLSDDRYFIFFNQRQSPEGSVTCVELQKNRAVFRLDLFLLPKKIQRLTFALTVDGENSLSQMGEGKLILRAHQKEVLKFNFSGKDFSSEKALMLFDIYFKDEWRVGAAGQGFNGGLNALLEHFGGKIVPQKKNTSMPRSLPKAPVRSKITLAKRGDYQKLALTKKDRPQTIHINLNWNQSYERKSLFGTKTYHADLDLGCMYELADGSKGVIQALNKDFGNRRGAPWIYLDKDDRSGLSSTGENLYITNPEQLKRIMVFAFVYSPGCKFTDVNGRIKISDNSGTEISIYLDSPESSKKFCAICTLDNRDNTLEITKEERYFTGHRDADRHYRYGFDWQYGTK